MSLCPIHPAALAPEALAAECELRFTRRSGPGGQNRNKVETAVIVTHRPTGIAAEASERRSRAENLNVAYFRLRLNLALSVRGERGSGSSPTALLRSRSRDGRLRVNPSHDDFPAILAEVLDHIEASACDIKAAAAFLACSPSQLIKLLKDEPRAFLQVNQSRVRLGRKVLL
jgi:hypothetical protein